MKEKLVEQGYIVNDSDGITWIMHTNVAKPQKIGKRKPTDKLLKQLNEGSEYIVIRDYQDEKEREFSVIVKDEDKYYFITDDKLD